MAILLPDFRGVSCLGLATCNFFEEKHQLVKDAMQVGADARIASYSSGDIKAYVRVFCAEKKHPHIHIDVFRKEVFEISGSTLPKVNTKRRELDDLLQKFEGQSVVSVVGGFFRANPHELPEGGLIRSALLNVSDNSLALSAEGATYSVKGAPIREFSWALMESGASVRLSLEAVVKAEIAESYLRDQVKLLESGYRVFILEEKSNDD